VPTSPLIEEIDRLAERFDLLDHELAAAIGCSPNTVRWARARGQAPKQRETLAAFERFLGRAKAATKRTDLALPAHPLRRGTK